MQNNKLVKILLIEDSKDIAAALSHVLASSHDITLAETGAMGLASAKRQEYDTIILDLNLPDMTGLEVCQRLRANDAETPIIILTGEDKVLNKIRLLDAGADDYLTKPFSLGELKARLRVLQRRGHKPLALADNLTVGELILDRKRHQVQRNGEPITLRKKEFALLECLMLHAGTVVSRNILGNYAWQESDKPWTNTIDVHIKHLRDKIDRPFEQQLIQTVHGLGYKLVVASAAPIKAGRS
ncbi:MAG TPA: response regulator transcription factor [Candidatus Saccharimonadales bacterium]|nr:response regulator transcription factor [Candidatus Saccharimonadales bacterium]